MAWKGIVGKSFTPATFADYLEGLKWTSWKPEFIVVHNTATPSLAQRPEGLTAQHIRNLETYYRDHQKWSAGPHLFIDDKQIWVFTALTTPGTHSPSWNKVALGIEMLGDFNKESFTEGRGRLVRRNTVQAVALLSARLGLPADGWRWHNQDPKTTHDCPGINARKERGFMVSEIEAAMALWRGPEAWPPVPPVLDKGSV